MANLRLERIEPQFVDNVPRELEEGVLYISQKHKIAVHKCASGCGEKVVTPLSPAGWRLIERAGLVSLYPSIGNWNFECKSHYWIRQNKILWDKQFSASEIADVQLRDQRDIEDYVRAVNAQRQAQDTGLLGDPELSFWQKVWAWVRQRRT